MELNDLVAKALQFFDAPETEMLDLDVLEKALRDVQEFLNTRNEQDADGVDTTSDSQPNATDNSGDGGGNLDNAGPESDQSTEITASEMISSVEFQSVCSERDHYRDWIVRQIQGYMHALRCTETEIAEVNSVADPAALIRLEEKIRQEFDRRFQNQPLVPDEAPNNVKNLRAFKIA